MIRHDRTREDVQIDFRNDFRKAGRDDIAMRFIELNRRV